MSRMSQTATQSNVLSNTVCSADFVSRLSHSLLHVMVMISGTTAAVALCIPCNVSSKTDCSADFLGRLLHRLLYVRLDPAAALCNPCHVWSKAVCSADFLCRLFHRLLHVRTCDGHELWDAALLRLLCRRCTVHSVQCLEQHCLLRRLSL